LSRNLKGKLRFAHAAGTGERQQSHVVAPKHCRGSGDLILPTDQRCQ
jgi:hypothetical protein